MSLYAIADSHLSFGTDKPMDVFSGWKDYTQRLEKNWNRLVSPQDYVVIAGDISWALDFDELAADFAYLHRLNGKKLIFRGNHDYWWNTKRKMDNFVLEHGFDSIEILHNSAVRAGPIAVCGSRGWMFGGETAQDQKILRREVLRLELSLKEAKKLGGEPVVFLHYPPVTSDAVCGEILDLLEREGIRRCYYGHLHGAAAKKALQQTIRSIKFSLISADYLSFCPI
ncbi:MAG: metallophosphoesterase, partial [Clostridiales bacterium]|nr:metallophosphoesterase [Clostridiales bacterium]